MHLFVICTHPVYVRQERAARLPFEHDAGTLGAELFSELVVALSEAAFGKSHVIVEGDDKNWRSGRIYDDAAYVVGDVVGVYADRHARYRKSVERILDLAHDLTHMELTPRGDMKS